MSPRRSIYDPRRPAVPPTGEPPACAGRRGSVLVIVMITLLFAAAALILFMDKASVDLLVDQREALTRRLRMEAYSALEVTLGVLTDFREANNGLHSPAEGWNDPLKFADYAPAEGRTVEVAFEDESGKISLPRADAQVLTNLFANWGISKQDAEAMADALLGWMQRSHVYSTGLVASYDYAAIPYEAPGRPLRSYQELAAIEKVREVFYDADGRPTEYWRRFADSVSLLDFARPNINGARPDTMAAMGQLDQTQQQNLGDYLRGAGAYQGQGAQFFQNPTDAQRIAGPTGNTGAFGTAISALRIIVTVREGRSEYRLAAVVAPPGGATSVQTTATATRVQTSSNAAKTTAQQTQANRPNTTTPNPRAASGAAAQSTPAAQNLKYPFTLLDMRENDEIPSAPPPPAAPSV